MTNPADYTAEEIESLERDRERLALIAARVEGLPKHPWIPGACFDEELCEAIGIRYNETYQAQREEGH